MCAISLASASAELRLDVNNFVTNAQRAADAAQGIQQATNNVTSGGFLGWVTDNEAALNRWGKGMLAVGGIITGAFAAPIIAGSRAAWGQVDAVEQATVAMRAYSDSAEEVDAVLAGLIEYARSDMGVLFQRQDLFDAAQSMLMYGASIEDVQGYVETLSLSVGLGLSNWDDLNRVIGRVGSTGRLTGNDFDYLRAAGFELDDSLRNTNITWEELFMHLEKGIPADALAGQADTIRGKTIRLQSALRGLGLAFLGVDSETSKFIEGGLGWQMMRGMERLTELMKRAAPAVQGFGNVIAAIGRPIGQLFDWLLRLPQPVQTAMLAFTAASGVLLTFGGALLMLSPQIAGAIIAFQKIGGLTGILGGVTKAVGALRVAMLGLFANPLILAGIAVIGAGILAYKTNFLGFGDMVRDAVGWVQDLFEALQLVFGTPSSKTISIYDDWQADKYTIQSTTLPDGTKVWNIVEDDTGETFGQILESYTDYDGTTYILIEPEGDGPAFWAAADLETGKPEKIDIPVIADDEPFQGTITTITSATGNEVTVLINGDGEPIGTVLDDIITDPETGTKTVTIEMGDGTTFTADVDDLKGTVTPLEITVNADTEDAQTNMDNLAGSAVAFAEGIKSAWDWLTKVGEQFDALMRHDWEKFDWRETLDLVGLESLIGPIETLIGWYQSLEEAVTGAWNAVQNFFGGDDSNIPQAVDRGGGVTATPRLPRGEGDTGPPLTQEGLMNRGAGIGLGAMLRDSAAASEMFSGALQKLNPEILRSNDAFNTTASTVPMYTSATKDADQATGAMASNMGTSFGNMAASAMSNFSSMQAEAGSRTSAMNSLVSGQTSSMQSSVAGHMLGMRTNAAMQAALMQSSATSSASTMASQVGGHVLGMRTAAALQMGLMASSAKTSGSQMNTGLTGWMTGALARIAATMASMVSTVRNAAGGGYAAGYYAGSMISQGFAAGMSAYLGQIRAAGNAMVAEASRAVIARAMISSPSRLFMQYGEYIGEGLEIGILGTIPNIGRAADRMLDASLPSPAFNTPIGHGGYGGTTVIDNSTHTTEYVALTESDFQQLLAAKDKANALHGQVTLRDGISQFNNRRGAK